MNCPICLNGVLELIGDLKPIEETYKLHVTDQINGHTGIGVFCCSVDECGYIYIKAAPGLLSSVKETMRIKRNESNESKIHQLLQS